MPDTILDAIRALDVTGRVCTPLRASQRAGLYTLLQAYTGMGSEDLALVGERDLVTMYDAACVNPSRGRIVADKIHARYSTQYSKNPLLDALVAPVAPPPAPTPAAPKDMSHYAMRSDLDAVRRNMTDMRTDLSARMGDLKTAASSAARELRDDVTATILKVTDAWQGALPDAISAVLADQVSAHVVEALKSLTPVTLTVVRPNTTPVALGMVHNKTATIVRKLSAGVNVYLHGPAGSGKTTVARKCAEAFGLDFYFAAKVESEYMLLGFKDARGETVRTQFREAYEHGGVFLFDELDGSSPSAVVALNAALANGICSFPDGVIMRHADFKCIAAGNTKLTGATREYVGRNQLDAASVDRFAFVEFGYDDALETALATNAVWCKYVQSARRAVAARALKHLVTPRATYDGCKLLEAGDTWEDCEDAILWKGLDAATVQQLKDAMDVKPPKPVEIL